MDRRRDVRRCNHHFVTESPTSAGAWILLTIIAVPGGWSSIAFGIRRLHDRNKSGWWVLLFYIAPNILDNVASSAERQGSSTVWIVAEAIGLAIGVWAFVELI